MLVANDNQPNPDNYPCYVLFFDSEADDAVASHIEGPFASYNDAIDYTMGAYAYARENNLHWNATEIVDADEIERRG